MSATPYLLDATGREIMQGDVLKVLHYTTRHGRGHKKHWMYKWVANSDRVGESTGTRFFEISNLGRDRNSYYLEAIDGRRLDHVWIVQGYGPKTADKPYGEHFEKRPRLERSAHEPG